MILIEELDNRFYIAESTIPEAGLGVFAAEDLKKGDYLEVIGVMVKNGSVADKCTHYSNSYKFSAQPLNKNNERLIVPMGYAAIINHAPNKNLQNVAIDMISPTERKKFRLANENSNSVIYRFIKDISKDEELLGNYGMNWDSAFKWAEKNIKSDWETFVDLNLYNLGLLKE